MANTITIIFLQCMMIPLLSNDVHHLQAKLVVRMRTTLCETLSDPITLFISFRNVVAKMATVLILIRAQRAGTKKFFKMLYTILMIFCLYQVGVKVVLTLKQRLS